MQTRRMKEDKEMASMEKNTREIGRVSQARRPIIGEEIWAKV